MTVSSIPFRRAFTEAVARLRDVEITDADWAEAVERLPDHLRIAFVALDDRGRQIERGTDLVALQRRLSGRTEQAVRSAVRGALAQAMAEARDRQSDRERRRGGKGRDRGRGRGADAAGATSTTGGPANATNPPGGAPAALGGPTGAGAGTAGPASGARRHT